MFFNFCHYYYALCFCSLVSCNTKTEVKFQLYCFTFCALEWAILIHMHTVDLIMHSFLLTLKDGKHIPFVLIFGDNGYNTPHTMTSGGLLWLTGFVWLRCVRRLKLHTCLHMGTPRQ
jgi:hypothetical protein